MNPLKPCLLYIMIHAFVPALTLASTPSALPEANARSIHQSVTGRAPSDLDLRFLQYRYQSGKSSADLTAELAAQTSAEREIRSQYLRLLGRDPAADEISLRVYRISRNLLSAEELTREIRSSEEYRDREARRIIHLVYKDLLDRNPAKACLEMQIPFMLRENLDEQALRTQVYRSEEYQRRLITQSYQALLHRNPDPSGMETYLNLMQKRGWSIDQVRADIQRSPEYQGKRK